MFSSEYSERLKDRRRTRGSEVFVGDDNVVTYWFKNANRYRITISTDRGRVSKNFRMPFISSCFDSSSKCTTEGRAQRNDNRASVLDFVQERL